MGYEVRPPEVFVPEDDPFQNDRLDRRQTAEALSRFIGTIDGPCVISLDAGWGMGKTTFLRMWQEHLRHQGFPVVMFNAWDNDFANEPFLALSEELQCALGDDGNGEGEEGGRLKEATIRVLANATPSLVRAAATMVTGGAVGDIAAGVVEHAMAVAEQDLTRYGAAKAAMKEFRDALEVAAAGRAPAESVSPPHVVLIDELDRCRPSYAVELLEVLKHLFVVKGVVFVLAVYRSQLEHAVKALYGAEFKAEVYLRRFFDVDMRLPDVNRDRFIDAQMEAIWQQLHAIRDIEADGWRQHEVVLDWTRRFIGSPEVDLRTAQQALQRLGLVLAMLEGDPAEAMLTAMLALILRTRDRDLYEQFVNREVDDEAIGNAVFDWVDPGFRTSAGGVRLEVTIIMAAMEVPPEAGGGVNEDLSGLYRLYHRFFTDQNFHAPDLDTDRSRIVYRSVHDAMRRVRTGRYPSFTDVVRRMELVVGDGHDMPA